MTGVLKKLLSLLSLSFKEHFIYWILPLSGTMIFLLMYCFGNYAMQEFVSPGFNREYGALEALQAIILAVVVYFSFKCFLHNRDLVTKLIFTIVILISIFIFLEEIDYGLTYYYFIFNVPLESRAVARSIHGQDYKELITMKNIMYVFIMIVFVLLPLTDGKWLPGFFRKFIPSPKIILCAIALEVISLSSSFFIYQLGYKGNQSLVGNISEFGEVIIYYMLLLYMIELSYRASKTTVPHKYLLKEKV